MAGNSDPIYSRRGNFTRGVKLTTAAADYTGVSPYNKEVFVADSANGSYLQRLRFKALGTNVATVARIYFNNGLLNTQLGTATPGAPTGTPSATGGTILASTTNFAMIIGIGALGEQTVIGTSSAAVTTTGSTASIAWSWTAIPGAVSYRIYVTDVALGAVYNRYFTSATNSFTQVLPVGAGIYDDPAIGNTKFYGEISLPATTGIQTAATVDIDYPINAALPPGWEVYVGLGTTVAAGWHVMGIGGDY